MEDKQNDYTGEFRRKIEKIYESTAEQLNTVVDMTYEGMKKECMTWGELQKKIQKEIDYRWDPIVPVESELKNQAAYLMRQRLKADMDRIKIDSFLEA